MDPDVRDVLQFGYTNAGALVSRTVPDVLAGLRESRDLEFVASSVSSFRTVAVYKTALARSDAMDRMYGFLREAGWRDYEITPPRDGFLNVFPGLDGVFCREGAMLVVVSLPSDDTTYVRLQNRTDGGGVPCDEFPDSLGGIARTTGGSNFQDHIPTLAIPGSAMAMDPQAGLVLGPSASWQSDRSVIIQVDLQTDLMSAEDILDLYAQQLEEQGWSYDTGWAGQFSSGSSWTRSPTAELELVGLLDVVALGNSAYRAMFRASSRESE